MSKLFDKIMIIKVAHNSTILLIIINIYIALLYEVTQSAIVIRNLVMIIEDLKLLHISDLRRTIDVATNLIIPNNILIAGS